MTHQITRMNATVNQRVKIIPDVGRIPLTGYIVAAEPTRVKINVEFPSGSCTRRWYSRHSSRWSPIANATGPVVKPRHLSRPNPYNENRGH